MRATPKKEIIKKIVVDLAIDEDVVTDVLSFAFSKALKAFKTGNSVELSGFGKFIFNPYSAKRCQEANMNKLAQMQKTLETPHPPKYVDYMEMLISQKKEAIEDINKRMINDKLEAHFGRVEKSSSSSGEPESSNKGNK